MDDGFRFETIWHVNFVVMAGALSRPEGRRLSRRLCPGHPRVLRQDDVDATQLWPSMTEDVLLSDFASLLHHQPANRQRTKRNRMPITRIH
jgi:hypothetical protein